MLRIHHGIFIDSLDFLFLFYLREGCVYKISHIQLFSNTIYCSLPEKEMATHSSILAWEIPWM